MKTNKSLYYNYKIVLLIINILFMNLLSNAKSNLRVTGISVGNDIETSVNMYDTKIIL